MNRLEVVLRGVGDALDRTDHRWCLVGGLAVSARTEPRFTRDIDLAVSVASDAAAEQLVHHLVRCGFRPVASLEHQAVGRLATVRLSPPSEAPTGIITDLLFASSGIEPETVAAAEPLELFPGLAIPVARLPHLVALKVLSQDDTRRPQDRLDLLKLLPHASSGDLTLVRHLLELIRERRCDRGRDLLASFEALLGSL